MTLQSPTSAWHWLSHCPPLMVLWLALPLAPLYMTWTFHDHLQVNLKQEWQDTRPPAPVAEKMRHVALIDRPHKGKSHLRRKKGKKDGRHD